MSTLTPRYPAPGARGLRTLGNGGEKPPRVASITDLSPEAWKHAIVTILGCGCGLLLSPTGDAGAVSVTLYFGDERAKGYAPTQDEMTELLGAAVDQAEAYELSLATGSRKKAPSTR